VIHNVLKPAEVTELPSPRESIRFGSAAGKHGPDHGFLNWGEPFCRLRDHEGIMPILRLRLGDCFRLDRLYGIRMHKGQTMGSMHADYGASALNLYDAFGPARWFWGTDITRMPCSWRQCVTLFTEELSWLKGRDLELVMGRAVCDWLGWKR
jgi:hypothetical protein